MRTILLMLGRRYRCVVLFLGVLAVGIALAQTVQGVDLGLLFLAPALVLVLPLLAGRYLGERQLERLRTAFRPRRVRAPRVLRAGGPSVVRSVSAAGGALLAASLGRRGPPRSVLRSF
ncbi:MAG: hypothetical protein JWM31_2387 [Solirubrobacterales bacterium]|nr:hypothetical protein [Solirubrobacterales bacterium]